MTDRLPTSLPCTLSRRARYALAILPLLMAQPPAVFAQDGKPGIGATEPTQGTRGLRQGPSSIDEPTGIQTLPPAAQPAAPELPTQPMQPAQMAPDPAPAGAPQAQPLPPIQPSQAAPPIAAPGPTAAEPQQVSDQDPPPRVGRVARLTGQVSYRSPGAQDWTPARMNFSVTSGTAIFTQPNARAAIEVNASRFAFDPNSDFQIQQLTEQGLVATLPQGQAFFRMSGMLPGETASVVTPRGTLTMQADGRYIVEAGNDRQPTRFTVLEGTAQAQGDGYQTPVPAGQTLVLVGAGAPTGSWTPAQPTALANWAATLEGKGPMPAAVRQMTGAETLVQYGRWDRNGQYGDIWYPRVDQGWAPYRNGQWVWRDPWGWTWVDDAPWGYAPSHYGRWVQVDGRWGWLPQTVTAYDPGYLPPPRPYWAPALVTFLPGVVLAGLAAPVSWVPLGPYEPFLPWWRASPRYVNYVNLGSVRNITVVNNYWTTNVWRGPAFAPGVVRPPFPGLGAFSNIRYATVVPGSVLTSGLRVAPVARPLPPSFVASPGGITPAFGGPIVRPIAQTPGLTPIGAGRLGLPVVPPTTRMPGPPPVSHTNLIARPGITGPAGAAIANPAVVGGGVPRFTPPGPTPGNPAIQAPPRITPPVGSPTAGSPAIQPPPHVTPPGVGSVGSLVVPPRGANQIPGATGPHVAPAGGTIGVPPPPVGAVPRIAPVNPAIGNPAIGRPGIGQVPNPGGPMTPPGGRTPGYGAPAGGFQPPPGSHPPSHGAPVGGYQPPPGGGAAPRFTPAAPPIQSAPPRFTPTAPPMQSAPPRFTPSSPPMQSAPPRFTPSAPVMQSAPPRPAASSPPPPPRPSAPPPRPSTPPPQQRNPNQPPR